MKKLLSILGSFTVNATGVSTVIACNEQIKDANKDTSTVITEQEEYKDLSTSLSDTVTFESGKLRTDFEIKLIEELQKQVHAISKWSIIISFERDVISSDDEIAKTTFTVNIKASAAGVKGEKVIAVAWTEQKDIDKLLSNTVNVASPKGLADFKVKLIVELEKQISVIKTYDIEMFKNDKKLEADDIVEGSIEIKIKIEGSYYEGEKVISVTWTEQTDIAKLLDDYIIVISPKYVGGFKIGLIESLNFQVPSITGDDIEIYKADGIISLTDKDIVRGGFKIKIKTKEGHYFTGEKSISITFSNDSRLDTVFKIKTNFSITSKEEIEDFKAKLIKKIHSQIPIVTSNNIKICKTDGTDLEKRNIESLMKVGIWPNGEDFTSFTNITVNWTPQS